jgi:hypothetical protein
MDKAYIEEWLNENIILQTIEKDSVEELIEIINYFADYLIIEKNTI